MTGASDAVSLPPPPLPPLSLSLSLSVCLSVRQIGTLVGFLESPESPAIGGREGPFSDEEPFVPLDAPRRTANRSRAPSFGAD